MAKGPFTQIRAQIQTDPAALPATVKSKLIYFSTADPGASRGDEESDLMRGADRHPTEPLPGQYDSSPSINSELMATCCQLYAALGSMESSMVGGTMGADLAVTAGTINASAQTLTLMKTAHGLTVGDSMEIAALTAPTSLNGKIWPVIAIPTADSFVLRIPMGTSSTFTKGAGTVKKVTAAGVLTHTMKAGGALPAYLLEFGYTDISQYLREFGCKVATFGFDVGVKGAIKTAFKWMGTNETQATSSFDSGTPLDNGKTSFNNLGITAANMKEGGAQVAKVLGVSFALDNQLDGDSFYVGGGGYRSDVDEGIYSIKGTVRAAFPDRTLYDKALNSTESSLDITCTRGTGAGTSGNEKIQIVTPELKYSPKSPPFNGRKSVIGEYAFTGFYDNGADATAFKVIVTNSLLPGAMI